MEQNTSITALLKRYTEGQLTEQEELYLMELMNDPASAENIKNTLADLIASRAGSAVVSTHNVSRVDAILAMDRGAESAAVPVRRLHFLRKWGWAAAVIVLAIGLSVYYFNNQSSKLPAIIEGTGGTVGTREDIEPGTDKAIWILADGKQVELDSTVLDMTEKRNSPDNIGYNELRTPKGGQYQLILPDGSKVWLNAASSIKYPVVFDGKERKVDVTGEAYFEVAKDVRKPFKVYSDEQEIEVLGTSFNVNVYNDEPVQKTTLVSGSIKVSANKQTAILKPGQQASIPITPITKIKQITVQTTNLEQDLAWKNGAFNFDDFNLQEAMRQIERWYNIEVEYKNGVPDIPFSGKISRSLSLNDLLETLSATKLQFTIENNRKIIITK